MLPGSFFVLRRMKKAHLLRYTQSSPFDIAEAMPQGSDFASLASVPF